MKKITKEINEIKYLFGYKRGRVISEQDEYEDLTNLDTRVTEDNDPDVAEPETKPRTRPSKPDTDREDKPFNPGRPNRDPNRLPYEDPDTHPQGEDDDDEIMYDLELSDPDVAEPETKPRTRPSKPDTDREDKPFNPGRPNRDPNRLPYEDPDTHPQGEDDDDEIMYDLELSDPDVAEPETKPRTRPSKPDTDREDKPFNPGRPNRDPNRLPYEDPDTHPQGDLKRFIQKYMNSKK